VHHEVEEIVGVGGAGDAADCQIQVPSLLVDSVERKVLEDQ
jgi:hypothetical protein